MIASPMKSCTRPRWARITSTIAVKYSFIIAETTSGGRRSDIVVNPRRSDIITVTRRTSPPSGAPVRRTWSITCGLTYWPNAERSRRRRTQCAPCR